MNHFLSLFVFSPLVGLLLLLFIPQKHARYVGLLGTLFPLTCAVVLYAWYWNGTDFGWFAENMKWIQFGQFAEAFQIRYELSITGLSFVMMALTTILSTLAVFAVREKKTFYMLLLILELGMLGVFAAGNLLLFFFFFELTLPTMFLLIGKWGKFESEKAAYQYLIYNGIGSAILLLVFAILFGKTGTTNFIGVAEALQAEDGLVSHSLKTGLFFALLVAFGIKLPIFPLHRWMVYVHTEAHPAVVMLHAGVLLKIGAYGLIRFGLGIFPDQFQRYAFLLAIIGVINVLYGAFLAFIQTDFRKVLAYGSISHMGIVLFGIAALNEAGIKGAVIQAVSHGLIAALLFLLVGMMEARFKTSDMTRFGGLAKQMPLFSGVLLTASLASLGLPGTSGFVGEFLSFLGLFQMHPIVAGIGTIGIIMTAVYMLRATLRITFGPSITEVRPDIGGTELIPVFLLIICIVAIGIVPQVLGGPLGAAVEMIGR